MFDRYLDANMAIFKNSDADMRAPTTRTELVITDQTYSRVNVQRKGNKKSEIEF